jgi:PRTRC genetic system ThiF family protein
MKPIKTYRLEIGAPEKALIMLVGCGGTGSYAALHLAQLAHTARQEMEIKLIFIDPDRVETKNVARQNFAPCEVGEFKAVTLARRYSAAFGLPIVSIPEKFSSGILTKYMLRPDFINLVVGCVDSTAARRDIHRAMVREMGEMREFEGRGLFWLDAGNYHAHGQVCLGNSLAAKPQLSPLGFAFALPLPSVQRPELIAPEEIETAQGEALSCAELVALEVQSRTINKMMAAWIDVYCERLLISRDLRMMATELDQRSGTAHSLPIANGEVVELTRAKPADNDEAVTDPCPDCGGELIEGYDVIDEAEGEVEVMFCNCGFKIRRVDYYETQDAEAMVTLMG